MNVLNKMIAMMGLLLPLSATAADYQWLTFRMADNTEMSVAAENLHINYSDNYLNLTSATVDEQVAITDLVSMRFTSLSSGVSELPDELQKEAEYFTVSGIKVGRFASVEEARRELRNGVYVAKSKTGTFKVIF